MTPLISTTTTLQHHRNNAVSSVARRGYALPLLVSSSSELGPLQNGWLPGRAHHHQFVEVEDQEEGGCRLEQDEPTEGDGGGSAPVLPPPTTAADAAQTTNTPQVQQQRQRNGDGTAHGASGQHDRGDNFGGGPMR